ncbi:transposase [Paraburkholderia hospita]|uniref:transposase n=1 Tax=Paraburkholderia hospita TaxID=169430 RepID=UPI000308FA19|nr:transposase [Paraburkholderia hospita]
MRRRGGAAAGDEQDSCRQPGSDALSDLRGRPTSALCAKFPSGLLHRVWRLSRALSRKHKGSKNRNKARERLARLHARIADSRKDFLHKLSTQLIRENQAVFMEDLCIRGMMRSHLARSIGDAA